MKLPVFYSAMLGWGTATVIMASWSLILDSSFFSRDWFGPILFYLFWTGILAFPACLIAGFLVTEYLPSSSPWWKPDNAGFLGVVYGFLSMSILVGILQGSPNIFQSDGWYSCAVAAAAGAVCGYSLGRFKQKLLKLESSTPHP